MRVLVRKDDTPYDKDYPAYLLGWVVFEGRVMAMVATKAGDMPWMIHQSRIEFLEEE